MCIQRNVYRELTGWVSLNTIIHSSLSSTFAKKFRTTKNTCSTYQMSLIIILRSRFCNKRTSKWKQEIMQQKTSVKRNGLLITWRGKTENGQRRDFNWKTFEICWCTCKTLFEFCQEVLYIFDRNAEISWKFAWKKVQKHNFLVSLTDRIQWVSMSRENLSQTDSNRFLA